MPGSFREAFLHHERSRVASTKRAHETTFRNFNIGL